MLYMVIVPIIPDYLRTIGAWETHQIGPKAQVQMVEKFYANATGNFSIISINKT